MARRTGPARRRPTIQETNEVWEVGRRILDVEVEELEAQGAQPEVFAALQNAPQPGMVRVDMLTSRERPAALADFVVRAIREPHAGVPRRPAVIRVSSAAEVELLESRQELEGITCEVAAQLPMLEELQDHLLSSFGHFPRDYRAQAARAGETLSPEMLLALFRAARAFFRRALWLAYDDRALFEIIIEPEHKPSTRAYGTIMGSMGETFGLALFPSLDDLRQLYERPEPPPPLPRGPGGRRGTAAEEEEALQEISQMMQAMQAPCISLTYGEEEEVPEALATEAQELHLPIAQPWAFPVIMRTGQGRMQVASASELVLMYVALCAILEWDHHRLDAEEGEFELTHTLTLEAVGKTSPMMTVHVTLQENPYAPEDDDEEEDDMEMEMPSEFISFFEKLSTEMPDFPPEPPSLPRSNSKPKRGKK